MENIFDSHYVQLVFSLDELASYQHVNSWKKFIQITFDSHDDPLFPILRQWIVTCSLESNKQLRVLSTDRIGNVDGKQIMFENMHNCETSKNVIVMNVYVTQNDKWAIEQLDDIIKSFCIICNKIISAQKNKGVYGIITFSKKF